MAEIPECKMCSDIFGNEPNHIKAPKSLKCGDSVCKECLEEVIKNCDGDFFLCPICKKENIQKKENVDEYTTNKELISIVNSFYNIPEKEEDEQEIDKQITFNIILLGDSAVGKTSIFRRFSRDKFSETSPSTVGCDTIDYYIKYKNQKYKLIFRDPAGQEKYRSITKSFMKKADGVLFIYDISNKGSFDHLETWYNLYKEENEKVIGLLIANKSDCKHKVSEEEAITFAREHKLKRYFETSWILLHTLGTRIQKSLMPSIIKRL